MYTVGGAVLYMWYNGFNLETGNIRITLLIYRHRNF
jgi:hypothetical protein